MTKTKKIPELLINKLLHQSWSLDKNRRVDCDGLIAFFGTLIPFVFILSVGCNRTADSNHQDPAGEKKSANPILKHGDSGIFQSNVPLESLTFRTIRTHTEHPQPKELPDRPLEYISHFKGIFLREGVIYAATDTGLETSPDGGKTWQTHKISDKANDNYAFTVYVDEKSIYLGTLTGLYISEDKGSTWTEEKQLSDTPVYHITSYHSRLYVSHLRGVDIRLENGIWMSKGSLDGLKSVNAITSTSTHLYAATMDGIYSSSDFGDSWQLKKSAWLVNGITALEDRVYGATQKGLLVSVDNGNSWQWKLQPDPIEKTCLNCIKKVEVSGSTLIAGNPDSLALSSDGGETFINKTVSHGLPSNSIDDLFVTSTNIYVASYKRLAISNR